MQQEITSLNNDIVKAAARLELKKYRDEEKKFLLEGFKAVEEALKDLIEIETIFINKDKASKYCFHCDANIILTTEDVLKKISTTDSAPEVVAIAKQKIFTINDIKDAKKVVLLEGIKDAGNLGTILRTSKAFSQDAVILFGDTVDVYNPKCVRSAVGNLWKLPIVQIKDFSVLKSAFKDFERVAALPHADDTINLKDFEAKPPYLIMFGSEADGLSQELINFSTKKLTIDMNSEVESLNLSISVGIILNHLVNNLCGK